MTSFLSVLLSHLVVVLLVVGLFLDKWYYLDKLELFICARQQHGNIEFSIVLRTFVADRVWHIASGGPPGGLPAATADSRQTPTLAARLMLRIPLKKYNEALRAATDRRARTAPCATSLARRQL